MTLIRYLLVTFLVLACGLSRIQESSLASRQETEKEEIR